MNKGNTVFDEQTGRNQVLGRSSFKNLLRDLPEIYGEQDVIREKKEGGGVRAIDAEDFVEQVSMFGAGLDSFGLLQEKVGLIGRPSAKWITSYFAQVCGGGTIVPVDPDLAPDEIASQLRETGVHGVIYDASAEKIVEEISSELPDVTIFIPMDGKADGSKQISFSAVCRAGRDQTAAYMRKTPRPDSLCTILFTPGTQGTKKGVMLSPRNILSAATGGLAHMSPGDAAITALPLHNAYEFTHGVVMMMCARTTICLNDAPENLIDNLRLFSPDILILDPVSVEELHHMIWEEARREGFEGELCDRLRDSEKLLADGKDLRKDLFPPVREFLGGRVNKVMCAGGPLDPTLSKAFQDFGVTFLHGYGLTECAPLISLNKEWAPKDASAGHVVPCCEVRVTNPDENGVGEICVKGTNVMLGYCNMPGQTAQAIRGDWFYTGDMGRVDEDGCLFVQGRKKNLIVLRTGEKVQPEEIEEMLKRTPYVSEVVVYASGRKGRQKALSAAIYTDEEKRGGMTDAELRAKIEESLEEINRRNPEHKHVAEFSIRSAPFEKTTRGAVKRTKAVERELKS